MNQLQRKTQHSSNMTKTDNQYQLLDVRYRPITAKNFEENVNLLIDKVNQTQIPIESIHDKPPNNVTALYKVFNCLLLSLPSMLWRLFPDKRDKYSEIRNELFINIEKNPKSMYDEWIKSINKSKDKHLLSSRDKVYVVPNFDVLDKLDLDNVWLEMPINEKSKFWDYLKTIYIVSDIIEFIPNEIFLGIEDVISIAPTIYGGSLVDRVTQSMIQSDSLLIGVKKLVTKMTSMIANPITPSYSRLMQKFHDQDGL